MPFDNICKRLAEFYPRDFAAWLLGQPVEEVEVLKTELSREPLRADSLIWLDYALTRNLSKNISRRISCKNQ